MPISNWSTTASSNATADSASGISWPEGMSPAQVNDSARAMMAETRKFYNAAVNEVSAEYTAFSGGLAAGIPFDDTIPQVTEGTQILSATITPTTATSKLYFVLTGQAAATSTSASVIAAVFVNGAANAIASTYATSTGSGVAVNIALSDEYSPASTSAQTFTVRVGPANTSFPVALNGDSGRRFGGSQRWSLYVREVLA